jgi:anionic cell wall polymer biosynthesis LytR-Cps2A-Psr (LCP) family protein
MAADEIIGGIKMTREELIKKTEQLCDLYLELEKEGVYHIIHSMGKVRVQCERHTLAKYAGDNPTETRVRDSTIFPTETFIELDKFKAFALDEGEE